MQVIGKRHCFLALLVVYAPLFSFCWDAKCWDTFTQTNNFIITRAVWRGHNYGWVEGFPPSYEPKLDLGSSGVLLPVWWYLGLTGPFSLALQDFGVDNWDGLSHWVKFGSPWGSSKQSLAFEARNSYFLHWVLWKLTCLSLPPKIQKERESAGEAAGWPRCHSSPLSFCSAAVFDISAAYFWF